MPKPSKGQNNRIPKVKISKEMSAEQREELLRTLEARFERNMNRHQGLEWSQVHSKLVVNSEKLSSLYAMESTDGEPDVIGYDEETEEYVFYDCSEETPVGRRNTCYDGEAQQERERKGVYPAGNAIDIAEAMGIEILTEEQYRELQQLGDFDTKTSSWVKTPSRIRKLGGALFCDRRYDTVFLYHNGAGSFYGVRGFRGELRV